VRRAETDVGRILFDAHQRITCTHAAAAAAAAAVDTVLCSIAQHSFLRRSMLIAIVVVIRTFFVTTPSFESTYVDIHVGSCAGRAGQCRAAAADIFGTPLFS